MSQVDTGDYFFWFSPVWDIFKINVHWQCCKWRLFVAPHIPLVPTSFKPQHMWSDQEIQCLSDLIYMRAAQSLDFCKLLSEAAAVFRDCTFTVWLCSSQILFFRLYANSHSWDHGLQEFKLTPYKMLEESSGTFRTWVNWSQLETEYRRWIFSWRGANNSW